MIFCDIPSQNVTKWCNTARNRSSVSALPFLGMASLFLSVVGVVNSSFITDEWNSCHKNALSGIQQQLGIELDASLVEWQWESAREEATGLRISFLGGADSFSSSGFSGFSFSLF